jgi:prevent-host-death family protein
MRSELVTALKRRATEIIAELEQSREPVLITQHGRPAAYLIDVDSYEALQNRLSVLEGIARGERAAEEGRTLTHRAARKRLARWLD